VKTEGRRTMKINPHKIKAIAEILGCDESEAEAMWTEMEREATPEEKSAIDEMIADLKERTGFEPVLSRLLEVK